MTTTTAAQTNREAISDAVNPLGLDGIEFIEYATSKPQALGQVLEMMGFRPVARHRSREVLLYRQGAINIIVNAQRRRMGVNDDVDSPLSVQQHFARAVPRHGPKAHHLQHLPQRLGFAGGVFDELNAIEPERVLRV